MGDKYSNKLFAEDMSNDTDSQENRYVGMKMTQTVPNVGMTKDVKRNAMGGNGVKLKDVPDFDKENSPENPKPVVSDNSLDARLKSQVFSDKTVNRIIESGSFANNEMPQKDLFSSEKIFTNNRIESDQNKQSKNDSTFKENFMKFDECTMQAIFNNGLENLIKGKLKKLAT